MKRFLFALLSLVPMLAGAQTAVSKKGACFTTKDPGWEARVAALNVSWHYSWGPELQATEPAGVQFVPMIWGKWNVAQKVANISKTQKRTTVALLGFNEPDNNEQSKMTVDEAIALWPELMKSGRRLGSPAPTHNPAAGWLGQFMQQARAKNYRVDFVTVHWYGGCDPEGLLSTLKKVHEAYQLPIWITEFAPADWNAHKTGKNRHTPEQVLAFMKAVLPKLDALPYVERYAWFSFGKNQLEGTSSALFNEDGTLTPLGVFYSKHTPAR